MSTWRKTFERWSATLPEGEYGITAFGPYHCSLKAREAIALTMCEMEEGNRMDEDASGTSAQTLTLTRTQMTQYNRMGLYYFTRCAIYLLGR